MEDFVEAALLFGRTLDVALEIELTRLFFKHFGRHAVFQLVRITFSLKLFSEVQFGADKDTGAVLGGRFHLCDPLVTRVFEGLAINQTEANQEAVRVGEGNRTQATQIVMPGRIPNLQLHLRTLVILRAIVRVKDGWLVEGRKLFLRPSHDHRRFTHSCVTHEDQLHVVFLVLIDHWFVYFSHSRFFFLKLLV